MKQNIPTPVKNEIVPENLFSEIQNTNSINALETKKTESQNIVKESAAGEIEKIVFFYKNGTFKVYSPD